MLSRNLIVTCLLLQVLCIPCLQAQTDRELPRALKDVIEQASRQSQSPCFEGQIAQELFHYLQYPLNLNQATPEQLGRLHLLTPFQINSFIAYRNQYGPLYSVYELPLIYGFNEQLARKLEPFVYTGSHRPQNNRQLPGPGQLLDQARKQLMLRTGRILEQQDGYRSRPDSVAEAHPNRCFLGSPMRVYTKLSLNYYDQLRAGVTLDKDPGETLFGHDNAHGFDFHSFHLFLQNNRWFDKLAIGDFDVRYGQGLITWSGFSLSKSSMVLNQVKNQACLDPYTSSNENKFFRGIGLEKSFSSWKLSCFYSGKKVDANLADTLINGRKVFTSLLESGYHRIPREIENERVIRERIMGGRLSYNRSRLKVGFNGLWYRFGGIYRRAPRPENAFRFSGRSNSNISLDYQAVMGPFYLFGEEALTPGRGMAFLNGLSGQLTDRVAMLILHRWYERDYQGLYSGGFSEGPRVQNERGIYWGLQLDLSAGLTFKGYLDTWCFPWLSYRCPAPSRGRGGLLELHYTPRKNLQMYLRYQGETRMVDGQDPLSGPAPVQPYPKTKLRYHLRYPITPAITGDNRIEWVSSGPGRKSSGWMIYQDLGYRSSNNPFGADIRCALFHTDDYHARIYAYEDDLLYAFSIPAYYAKGYRTYLNMKYSWNEVDFWLKWARTHYFNKQTIGSGLNQIRGPHKSSLYFQIRVNF